MPDGEPEHQPPAAFQSLDDVMEEIKETAIAIMMDKRKIEPTDWENMTEVHNLMAFVDQVGWLVRRWEFRNQPLCADTQHVCDKVQRQLADISEQVFQMEATRHNGAKGFIQTPKKHSLYHAFRTGEHCQELRAANREPPVDDQCLWMSLNELHNKVIADVTMEMHRIQQEQIRFANSSHGSLSEAWIDEQWWEMDDRRQALEDLVQELRNADS